MQRQLFLHHYLPALYFAILLFCTVFDYTTSALRPKIRANIAIAILILALWSWNHWSSLAYAGEWTKSACENGKWLRTWDFSWYVSIRFHTFTHTHMEPTANNLLKHSNDFYESTSMYNSHAAMSSEKIAATDLGPDSATTTLIEDIPEPIQNVFQQDPPPEEKTIAPVGPAPVVQMEESSAVFIPEGEEAPIVEDLRAPVGNDAGDPAVTDGEDDGGWHGGAEEGQHGQRKDEVKTKEGEAPVGATVDIPDMGMDEEQKLLVDQIMDEQE